MEWKVLDRDCMPQEKEDVLLLWSIPGLKPIIRIGSILHKPWGSEKLIWKFEYDHGDCGGWVYSNRDDEQPTYWAELPADPRLDDGSDTSTTNEVCSLGY